MTIKDFVDDNLGDEKKAINAFVDDIDKIGGIDGRKIVPDIKEKVTPIKDASNRKCAKAARSGSWHCGPGQARRGG